MVYIQWLLVMGIMIMLILTAYYSVKARRSQEPRARGLNTAHMNISMGVMLVLMSLIQMVMFSGSTVRLIVGAIFLLLGLFNLFAGLRNKSLFSAMKQQS
ncbi:YtpI family protein [Paenibacillus sp. SYP-B4298]|uniref:YtpI family protein n=1 Tax=Paenibacillus sp. SYP-B4298 TaxID=2996034 RepID=UPI0022DD1787|nr:YtpI family protein [Paenibacillus sp. SYP-B4298]